MVKGINTDINEGKGAVNALLKDSAIVIKLNKSLENIEKGTTSFNQNMEALKHHFCSAAISKNWKAERKRS